MSPAKENTWRGLTGEIPLMLWSCRFGIHSWTVWEMHENYTHGYDDYVRHYKKCSHCKIIKFKITKIPKY